MTNKPTVTPKTSAEKSAKWRKTNPEAYKKSYLESYKKNKEYLRAYQDDWRKKNPDYFKTPKAVGYKNTPEGWSKYKLNSIKTQAKARGLEVSITWQDICEQIVEYCPVLGIKLNYLVFNGKTKMGIDSPSIDRIDNSKGYVKGNIIIISNLANRVKTNLQLNEIEPIMTKIINFYKKYTNEQ